MARVKRGVTSHAKHKKVFKAAKGFYGRRKNTIRIAKQAVEKAQPIRLPRPQAAQAHLPGAVDPAPERRGAARSASPTADLSTASPRPASRSTARCCPISRSTSRRHSRRSSRRPRPRCPQAERRRDRSAAGRRSAIRLRSRGAALSRRGRDDRSRLCAAHGALQSLAERRTSTASPTRSRDDERRRERGAFFGSIHKTLSHLLWADRIWMSRFTDVPKPEGGIPESVSLYPTTGTA